jgi:3-hydroxymyristoyl/3-hydroxydecanoyl-(acyl carrier protein) dehydratase
VANAFSPAGGKLLEYLASIERFKFLSPAEPGETLTVEARIVRRAGDLVQARVDASVKNRSVAEGILIVTARHARAPRHLSP